MSVTDWSPQPNGNAVADPSIPARDGMAGREIASALRAMMAGIAAYVLDQNGSLRTGGTANAYTLTTHSGVGELKPGLSFTFIADRDSTDASTLNVDGLGPAPFMSPSGLPLIGGSIKRGLLYSVVWTDAIDAVPAGWRLRGAAAVLNGNDFQALGHTSVFDRDYAALTSDVQVGFRTLTGPRLVTLPDVDAFPLGQDLVIADESGNCSDTVTIKIQPGAGTGDLIGGAVPDAGTSIPTILLSYPYQAVRFRRGAANLWIRL